MGLIANQHSGHAVLALGLATVLASVFAESSGAATVTLSQGSSAQAVIVLAADAELPETHAAEELADFLGQITGGTFPILHAADTNQANLFVGPGAALLGDPAFTTAGLGGDGTVIRTVSNGVILAGGRPRGTLYAVYSFLEDHVGCRWWSESDSTIPSTPSLVIPDLNVTYVPPFDYRQVSYLNARDKDFSARNKLNGHVQQVNKKRGGRRLAYLANEKWSAHSMETLVPMATYGGSNPQWYCTPDGLIAHDFTQASMRTTAVANLKLMLNGNNPLQASNTGLSEVRFHLHNSADFVGNPGAGNGWDTRGSVTASASSSHPARPPARCVDGSGLDATGLFHDTDVGTSIYASGAEGSSAPFTPYNAGTVDGMHWVAFQFDQVYPLGEMWVWNQNEPVWHVQGPKNVTIQYSTTGGSTTGEWSTIFSGELDKAWGYPGQAHDAVIDFAGASARWVVITIHDTWLLNTDDVSMASFSQNDGWLPCETPASDAIVAQEGGYAGVLMRFVNDAAADMAGDHPDLAIHTLAYHYSVRAPSLTVPHSNVVVELVTAAEAIVPQGTPGGEPSWSVPLDHARNRWFYDEIVAWSQISPRLHIWEYATAFQDPYVPIPNLRVLAPNKAIYAAQGVKGVQSEGWSFGMGTDMAEIRSWMIAKLYWDPTLDGQSLIETFCNGYYGAAGPNVIAYINLLHNDAEARGEWLPQGTGPHSPYLSYDTMNQSWNHLAAGETAVLSDPELLKRIRVAQIPILYIFVNRWYEFRDRAAALGNPWPLPARFQEAHALIRQYGEARYPFRFVPPALPAPTGPLNLGGLPLTRYAAATQPENGTATIEDNNATLHMTGNVWRKFDLSYNVTAKTVLEFDLKVSQLGEIHAIGFDTDDNESPSMGFRLFGTEAWAGSVEDFYTPGVPSSEWQHFRIPVGTFYTGAMNDLFVVNDHDGGSRNAESLFSNIRVFEGAGAGSVIVTVSSQHSGARAGVNAGNGSGLSEDGLRHDADVNNMWMSSILAESVSNPRGGTVTGSHWIEFDFGDVKSVDEMWIWNYNEPPWRIQGMKDITIQYSTTGSGNPADWTTVYDGQLPMASSVGPDDETDVSLVVPFHGTGARYVVITADAGIGMNWSNGSSDRAALSEVRFSFLGNVVPILGTAAEIMVILSFQSDAGKRYRLESSTDPWSMPWSPSAYSLTGDGSVMNAYEDMAGASHRVYRLVLE